MKTLIHPDVVRAAAVCALAVIVASANALSGPPPAPNGSATGLRAGYAQSFGGDYGSGVSTFLLTSDYGGYGTHRWDPSGPWSGASVSDTPVSGAFMDAPAGPHWRDSRDRGGLEAFVLPGSHSLLGAPVSVNGPYQGLPQGPLFGGAVAAVGGVLAPIPEPESYAMMLAGLVVVGFIARRRMRRG